MALELRNFVKGTVRTLQSSITDLSSSKLTLNLDSDKELGSLISRKGTSLVGSQLIASRSCLGIGNFRDTTGGSSHKLFAAFPDGTNTDIYDVEAGTKSLEDDTKDLKTYFVQYLGAMLRTNGTDLPKYYNGTSWQNSPTGANFTAAVTDIITSAGHGLLDGDIVVFTTTDTLPAGLSLSTNYYVRDKTTDTFKVSLTKGGSVVDITSTGAGTHTWAYWDPFDIANIPTGMNYPLEWKDKIYGAKGSILYYSTVADPDTLTLNWTGTTAGQIQVEQEDNGGDITALAKIPGYLLIFKERSLKRFDGAQTYPDDLIRQGAPCQEAVCVSKGMCGFLNHKGIWLTNGGYPQRISKSIQDFVDAIPVANLTSVSSWADDEYMCWSIGNVTVEDRDYTNIVLKYNVDFQSWDIYSYHNSFQQFARYIDTSDNDVIVGGDADGHILQINSGYSDFEDGGVKPIEWIHETPDLEFGSRGNIKAINVMLIYTKNVSTGRVMKRINSSKPEDWEEIEDTKISKPIEKLEGLKIEGNWINIKTTGTTNTTQAKILGYEFPEDNIKQSRNADQ